MTIFPFSLETLLPFSLHWIGFAGSGFPFSLETLRIILDTDSNIEVLFPFSLETLLSEEVHEDKGQG